MALCASFSNDSFSANSVFSLRVFVLSLSLINCCSVSSASLVLINSSCILRCSAIILFLSLIIFNSFLLSFLADFDGVTDTPFFSSFPSLSSLSPLPSLQSTTAVGMDISEGDIPCTAFLESRSRILSAVWGILPPPLTLGSLSGFGVGYCVVWCG